MSFGIASKEHLALLHPDLAFVLNEVMEDGGEDFAIIDSLRDEESQTRAFNGGASKAEWPTSYHNGSIDDDGNWNPNISDAVDIVPYPVEWPEKKDPPHEYVRKMSRFFNLAERVLAKAYELGIELEWGGMFKKWFDGPHFQRKRNDMAI